MSFTFGELKTAIQSYTDNSEATFVANISNFIKAAEQRIFSNVDLDYLVVAGGGAGGFSSIKFSWWWIR